MTWAGLSAPARTPAPIIDKLNKAVATVLSDAETAQRLAAQGAEAQPSTPETFLRYMREESERARKVIRIANIKADGS